MRDDESKAKNLPLNSHLQEDISTSPDDAEETEETGDHFTPAQTNAGQQVAGLASAPDYGEDQDPGSRTDGNNPV